VTVESILSGTSVVLTSPSRAASAPMATSDSTSSSGRKTLLDPSSQSQKGWADRYGVTVTDWRKPRENGELAVPGSSTKSGERPVEDEMSSSPEVKSSGSSDHTSPSSGGKGRGRGRGDFLAPPAGRGRGLSQIVRRRSKGGVEETEVGMKVVAEELSSKEELVSPQEGREIGMSRQQVIGENSEKMELKGRGRSSKDEDGREDLGLRAVTSLQYRGLDEGEQSHMGYDNESWGAGRSWGEFGASDMRKNEQWSEVKSVGELADLSGCLPERKNIFIKSRRKDSNVGSSGQAKKDPLVEDTGPLGAAMSVGGNYVPSNSGSAELSNRSDFAVEEVWSVTSDTAATKEPSSGHSMRKKALEERLSSSEREEGSREQGPERTEGDVWDSADEMDLSREEEEDKEKGTLLTKGSEAERKSVEVVVRDKVYEQDGGIEPPPGMLAKDGSSKSKVRGRFTKRRLKDIEEALEATLFERYVKEGQMDEAKYSLKDQKKLVTQLIKESDMVRGGRQQRSEEVKDQDESRWSPTGDQCLSLESILERARVDSRHTQLPNMLIEKMFQDRQLVPRWKLGGVDEVSSKELPSMEALRKVSHNESRLLKFFSSVKKEEGEGHSSDVSSVNGGELNDRKLTSVSGSGNECSSSADDDGREVDDPAIMHIVVAKQPPASKETVESLWKDKELQHSALIPQAAESSNLLRNGLEEKVSDDASSLSWLSESPHWANPGLLSADLSRNNADSLPRVVKGRGDTRPMAKGGRQEFLQKDTTVDEAPHKTPSVESNGKGVVDRSTFSRTVGSKSNSKNKILSPTEQVFVEDYDLKSEDINFGGSEDRVFDEFDKEMGSSQAAAAGEIPGFSGSKRRKHGIEGVAVMKGREEGSSNSDKFNGQNDLTNLSEFPPLKRDLQTDDLGWGQVSEEVLTFPSAIDENRSSAGYGSLHHVTTSTLTSSTSSQRSGSLQVGGSTCKSSSDIDFLVECFPDLSREHLHELLEVNDGNVELTTISALSAQRDVEDELWEESSANNLGVFAASGPLHESSETLSRDFQDVAADDEWETSSRQSGPRLVLWNESMGSSDGHHLGNEKDLDNNILEWDVALDDEEEKYSGGSSGVVQNETGFLQEDNLVLKLSESLAIQLQALFGPVDQSLFQQGELSLLVYCPLCVCLCN